MNSQARQKHSHAYEPLNRLTSNSRLREKFGDTGIIVGSLVCILIMFVLVSGTKHPGLRKMNKNIQVSTWNVASINNNPFEYFIDVDETFQHSYDQLMHSIQQMMENPESVDKPLAEVLNEEMASQLFDYMRINEMPFIDEVKQQWNDIYSSKLLVSDFLTNKDLGAKRLVSMPDRVTNTIRFQKSVLYRPAIINCYKDSFSSKEEFWNQWLEFMFSSAYDGFVPVENFKAISKAKYPAISEEESRISKSLEILIMALFDLSLFEVIGVIFENDFESFRKLREHICQNMNENKNTKILQILKDSYQTQDVIFLQEVSDELINLLNLDITLNYVFDIEIPLKKSKSDQSSIILTKKENILGELSSFVEITEQVLDFLVEKSLVDDGDFFAIKSESSNIILASFHGDTNGLATVPIVEALSNYLSIDSHQRYKFIFGLDANTYAHPIQGVNQGFLDFLNFLSTIDFGSFWDTKSGEMPSINNHTTYNARTYLQPQLNKAIKKENILESGDVNPKDFVLFLKRDFVNSGFIKDNTGKRTFKENSVFPSSIFPSDHAIVSTSLSPLN